MPTNPVAQPPPTTTAADAPQCPLCAYDLRGLAEPRCPECGYRFTWEELASAELRLHPYLFEHHPQRNAWAFRRTLLGGLRPTSFWRTLFPTQPSRPRRLVLYGLIVACAWLFVLAVQTARSFAAVDAERTAQRQGLVAMFPKQPASFQKAILKSFGSSRAWAATQVPGWPHPDFLMRLARARLLDATLFAAALWLAWPWLTLAGLMIFQISMRRARVRPIHVLRCVIYAGDVSLWAAAGMLAVIANDVMSQGLVGSAAGRGSEGTVILGSAILLLVATYRLGVAYRDYLRFDHAFATAAAVQLMVLLLAYKGVLDWLHYF